MKNASLKRFPPFFFAFLFAAAAPLAQAQMWESTGGPAPGGLIRGPTISATGDSWAGVYGAGMFRSTDGGYNWTPMNNGLANKFLSGYVVATGATPYRGYAASRGGGIYKTTDGGNNWAPVNTGLGCTNIRNITVISFGTSATDTLLAGTNCRTQSGIYRSSDGGANWTLTTGLPADVFVWTISRVAPSGSGIDLIFASTDSGIYKSGDNGVTWALSNGAAPNAIAGPIGPYAFSVGWLYDAANGLTLVAAVAGNGFFRSTDHGASWSNVFAANKSFAFGAVGDQANGHFYVFVDGEGYYRSTDRGNTWQLFLPGSTLPAGVMLRQGANSAYYIASTLAGIYRSSDGGNTWTPSNNGLPGGYAINVQADTGNGDAYAATADAVYRCAGALNGANCTWQRIGGGNLGHFSHSGGHVLVAAAGVYAITSNMGVFKYSGAADQWTAMNNGLPNMTMQGGSLRGDPNNANGLWLGLETRGMYYSADGGANWVAKNGGLSGAQLHINWIKATPSMVVIATEGGLFKSTDNGATWTNLPFPAMSTATPPAPLSIDKLDIDAVTGNMYAAVSGINRLGVPWGDSGLWKSTDGGATWTKLAQLAGKRVHDVRAARPSGSTLTLYAALWDDVGGGMWQSTDDGATWSAISNGLPNPTVSSIGIVNGVLEAVATYGDGVLKWNSGSSTASFSDWRWAGVTIDGGQTHYGVGYGAYDPGQLLSSVTITFGGTTVNGVYWTADNNWHADLQLGTTQPSLSNVYTGTYTSKAGVTTTKTFTIDKFPSDYPSNIQPSAGQNVTGTPVFSWTPAAGTNYKYGLNLGFAATGGSLWTKYNIAANSAAYDGPALVPGTLYKFWVHTDSTNTALGINYGAGVAETFCFQCGGTSTSAASTTTTTSAGSTSTTTTASTTTTTLAGTGGPVTLNFSAGWNLVGNSADATLDVATAFGDATKLSTVWKWVADTAKWAFYAPSLVAQQLTDYAASKGYDVLTTIAGGEGFWVNARTSFTAQLPAGTAVASVGFQDPLVGTGRLVKGWNLIAIGDNKTPSEFNKALSVEPPAPGEIPLNVTTLWAWDSAQSNWYFYAPSLEKSGGLSSYIQSKGYLDFGARTLDPATGFWVNRP